MIISGRYSRNTPSDKVLLRIFKSSRERGLGLTVLEVGMNFS